VSIHGYLPEHREKDGVLVSNIPLGGKEKVELVDIAPSLLALFGVKTNGGFDGKCLWA
jgi:hypothetical protein